jgi:hypothetical protein
MKIAGFQDHRDLQETYSRRHRHSKKKRKGSRLDAMPPVRSKLLQRNVTGRAVR